MLHTQRQGSKTLVQIVRATSTHRTLATHLNEYRPILLVEIRIVNVVVIREGSVVITAEMIQG